MRVSLCMIVKDEEANLPACLADVAGLVDEVVVADTGSSDATPALAERAGALLVRHTWSDDFGAARNAALERASGEWILWMDADDRLDAGSQQRLAALLRGLEDQLLGFEMTCESLSRAGTHRQRQVRLFRRGPGVRWRGRIHEQVGPSILAAGGRLLPSDVVIRHTGYGDPERHREKLRRNLRLLELSVQEEPEDPWLLFHIGWTRVALGQVTEGLAPLTRSLELSPAGASWLRGVFGQLVRAHHLLGRREAALTLCLQGLRRFPDFGELGFMEGVLRMETGDLRGAVGAFRRLLEPGAAWACNDPDLVGYKARQNLGALHFRLDRLADAEREWRAVLAERPDCEPARRGLAAIEQRRAAGSRSGS
jgi:tetratricopeptide (TPR) repeat protein